MSPITSMRPCCVYGVGGWREEGGWVEEREGWVGCGWVGGWAGWVGLYDHTPVRPFVGGWVGGWVGLGWAVGVSLWCWRAACWVDGWAVGVGGWVETARTMVMWAA